MTTYTHLVVETVAALMDAFVEAEHPALNCRAILKGGQQPTEAEAAAGLEAEAYLAMREAQGSGALRSAIIDLAVEVETVWANLPEDVRDGGLVWDFEFCPEALRLYVVEGLTGDEFRQRLTAWAYREAALTELRFEQQKRETAEAALAKAQGEIERLKKQRIPVVVVAA
ncbi:MAG: hypothetical protein EPO54_14900 [Brevundimonas sp.]|nr:MAG: hypothetical protein EPO54_14900 [Brevundimonas sp.]